MNEFVFKPAAEFPPEHADQSWRGTLLRDWPQIVFPAAGRCTFLAWLWQSLKNCLVRNNFGLNRQGVGMVFDTKTKKAFKPPENKKVENSFKCILIYHLHHFHMQMTLLRIGISPATVLKPLNGKIPSVVWGIVWIRATTFKSFHYWFTASCQESFLIPQSSVQQVDVPLTSSRAP